MASSWQSAKREAKKRARISGYCWVYLNPEIGKLNYLFYESEVDALPPWVPKNATRFGNGPYVPPPYTPSIDDVLDELKWVKREISRLLDDH